MKISYIITTFNRFETLVKHLESNLFFRHLDKDEFADQLEIIIADDGTKYTDEQLLIINKLADKLVCTDSFEKATPSKARNLGIAAATGDLLIFADDDCLPHDNLIEEFKKLKKGFIGVGYKKSDELILKLDSNNLEEIEKSLEGMAATLYFERFKVGLFNEGHFTSGSCAIWREDLDDTRYDEDFVGYGYEDKHFGCLLAQRGLKFEYMIRAMSYHCHSLNRPRSLKDEEAIRNKKLFYDKIGK